MYSHIELKKENLSDNSSTTKQQQPSPLSAAADIKKSSSVDKRDDLKPTQMNDADDAAKLDYD
jgi:hypothetical protein